MSKRSRSSHSRHSDDSDSHQSPNSISTRMGRRQTGGAVSERDKLSKLLARVKHYRNEDGETIFDVFWAAPSKRSAPEYYEAISHPIDLATIQTRVREEYYKTVDQLQSDVELLSDNIKKFYPSDSDEYKAGDVLMTVFLREKDAIMNCDPTQTLDNNDSSSKPPPAKKRGRSRMSEPVSLMDFSTDQCSVTQTSESASETTDTNSQGSYVNPKLATLFQNYFSVVAKHVTEEGRPLSAIFTHVPSKKLYPDYYEVIHEPMDFRMIAEKIQKSEYQNLQEICQDFQRIAKNAKIYNEPRSPVYEDAKELGRIAKQKCNEIEKKAVKKGVRALPGAAQITEGYAKAQPREETMMAPDSADDDDDDSEDEENRKLEKGQDIRFPPADPRYPFRRLYDSISRLHICEPFMRLPSTKLYPDYYEEITFPISMLIIRNKINKSLYRSFADIVKDFDLLFTNAQTYNRDDSEIYKYSVKLQHTIHVAKEEIMQSLSDSFPVMHGSLADNSNTSIGQQPFSIKSELSQELNHSSSSTPCLNDILSETTAADDQHLVKSGIAKQFGKNTVAKFPKLGRWEKPVRDPALIERRLQALYNDVNDYQENGRRLNEMFIELPSRTEYPDYYDIIHTPIDLTTIKEKWDKKKYKSASQMANDMKLMFNNAKHYNEEGSQVYNDAVALELVMRRRMRNLGEPHFNRKSIDRRIKDERSPEVPTEDVLCHMRELYLTVKEYRDQNGILLSVPFLRLPTPQEMPQYYEIIRKPVELLGIGQKLDQGKYYYIDEFMADMLLMFKNACDFNEPNSDIYKSACTLRRALLDKKAVIMSDIALLSVRMSQPLEDYPTFTKAPDVAASVYALLNEIHSHLIKFYETYASSIQMEDNKSSAAHNLEGLLSDNPPLLSVSMVFQQITDRLKNNKYLRLDQFQADILKVLKGLRLQHVIDSKEYSATCNLVRQFLSIRDEVTDKGKRLLSPALRYTETRFSNDLQKEVNTETTHLKSEKSVSTYPTPSTNDLTGDSLLTDITLKDVRLDLTRPNTEISAESGEKNYFEQIVMENGTLVRLGDFIYVENSAQDKLVVSIHRLWRKNDEDSINFSGPIFRSGAYVAQMIGNTFYSQEMVITDKVYTVNFPINTIVNKCFIMDMADYCRFRPTQYAENDVYLCISKFFVDRNGLHKLRFGLKKFHNGPQTQEDELYFFPEALKMKKSSFSRRHEYRTKETPTNVSQEPRSTRPKRPVQPTVIDTEGIPQEILEKDMKKNFRKPPSGFVIYAGEKRKELTPMRPEAQFGDVSREIGSTWRNLSDGDRKYYEKRAKIIRVYMEGAEKDKELGENKGDQAFGAHIQGQAGSSSSEASSSLAPHDVSVPMSLPQNGMNNYMGFNKFGAALPNAYHGISLHEHGEHYLPNGTESIQPPQQPPFSNGMAPPLSGASHPAYPYMSNGMSMPQHPMGTPQGHPTQNMYYPQSQAPPTSSYPQFTNQQVAPNMMHPTQAQMMNMNMMMRPRMNLPTQGHPSMHPNGTGHLPLPPHSMQPPHLRPTQVSPRSSDPNAHTISGISAEHFASNGHTISSRPATPLFVPVSPKPVKLLHSKVYSKHIETLRKNDEHLSNWDKQTAGANEAPKSQNMEQISSHFLSKECWRPQHNTAADALWALRDHLLRDALNIKTKLLGFNEAV